MATRQPRHDPGPEAANRRAKKVADAAAEPMKIGQASVRVGTASWTDPTMTAPGVFYPADADTPEERLRFYATQFPVVEVDATYYALPSRRMGEVGTSGPRPTSGSTSRPTR